MIVTPRDFAPRPYQRIAVDFLLNTPRCLLAAVPGLGKTASVYALLDILKLAGSSFFPVLVIAPLKVAENVWPSEQKKWTDFADLKIIPILGERDVRDDALLRRGDVYVINYENIPWLVQRLGKRWPFKIVVADESTKLKNFKLRGGGTRSTALSQIAQHTGRWINLTGTPAPNGLRNLWGQMYFVDFGARLGHTYTAFMDRWFTVNAYDRTVTPRKGASEEIYALLADVMLALRAEDWLPIVQPITFDREVILPPAARKQYDRMESEFFIELANMTEVEAMNAASQSSKLLQMASGAVYDAARTAHHLHDAKIEGLRSIMDELGGEPLLLAYWFKFEVPMLQKAFPEFRIYDGKKTEDEWNEGRIPLMGIHPASDAHGVNLQYGGRALAHFTHTWDLELRQQVSERIGPVRQLQAGFDRAVLEYNITAQDTIDYEVLERHVSKRSVQDALMLARAHRNPAMAGLL